MNDEINQIKVLFSFHLKQFIYHQIRSYLNNKLLISALDSCLHPSTTEETYLELLNYIEMCNSSVPVRFTQNQIL